MVVVVKAAARAGVGARVQHEELLELFAGVGRADLLPEDEVKDACQRPRDDPHERDQEPGRAARPRDTHTDDQGRPRSKRGQAQRQN